MMFIAANLYSQDSIIQDSTLNISIQQISTIHIDSAYKLPLISRAITDSMLEYSMHFIGVPYQYGGKSKKGFDCSGFVATMYGNYGFHMPSSSSNYNHFGRGVSKKACRPGDVICFNGRKARSGRIGHVGIITEIKDNEIYFIHASVQRGVTLSKVSEAYYKPRFVTIKRILP